MNEKSFPFRIRFYDASTKTFRLFQIDKLDYPVKIPVEQILQTFFIRTDGIKIYQGTERIEGFITSKELEKKLQFVIYQADFYFVDSIDVMISFEGRKREYFLDTGVKLGDALKQNIDQYSESPDDYIIKENNKLISPEIPITVYNSERGQPSLTIERENDYENYDNFISQSIDYIFFSDNIYNDRNNKFVIDILPEDEDLSVRTIQLRLLKLYPSCFDMFTLPFISVKSDLNERELNPECIFPNSLNNTFYLKKNEFHISSVYESPPNSNSPENTIIIYDIFGRDYKIVVQKRIPTLQDIFDFIERSELRNIFPHPGIIACDQLFVADDQFIIENDQRIPVDEKNKHVIIINTKNDPIKLTSNELNEITQMQGICPRQSGASNQASNDMMSQVNNGQNQSDPEINRKSIYSQSAQSSYTSHNSSYSHPEPTYPTNSSFIPPNPDQNSYFVPPPPINQQINNKQSANNMNPGYANREIFVQSPVNDSRTQSAQINDSIQPHIASSGSCLNELDNNPDVIEFWNGFLQFAIDYYSELLSKDIQEHS